MGSGWANPLSFSALDVLGNVAHAHLQKTHVAVASGLRQDPQDPPIAAHVQGGVRLLERAGRSSATLRGFGHFTERVHEYAQRVVEEGRCIQHYYFRSGRRRLGMGLRAGCSLEESQSLPNDALVYPLPLAHVVELTAAIMRPQRDLGRGACHLKLLPPQLPQAQRLLRQDRQEDSGGKDAAGGVKSKQAPTAVSVSTANDHATAATTTTTTAAKLIPPAGPHFI